MGVRISAAVLAACCVWSAAEARAQSFGDPAYGPPGWGEPGVFPPGPGHAMPYGGAFPGGGFPGEPMFAGSPPHAGQAPGTAELYPESAGAPPAHPRGCPCPQCQRPTVLERVWGMDEVLVNSFTPPLTGTWVRAEYLNWRFKKPGAELIGSSLSTVEEPRYGFPIFDVPIPPNTATQIGVGRVPTLDDIRLEGAQGGRLTYGVPLTFGEFELSGLVFDQVGDFGGVVRELRQPGVYAATSTFLNGEQFNNIQLWDEALRYDYKADLWGLDARVVAHRGQVGEGLHLKPIVGLKLLNLTEHMTQLGLFSNQGTRPLQTGLVESKTFNYLYGPTLGTRLELEHRWFQIGIDPRVTLGLNSYQARVKTANFVGQGDPVFLTETSDTAFSPVFEVQAWLRVPVTENLSIFGGYDLLHAPKVARPATAIHYDVIVTPTERRSNVHAKKHLSEWNAHGISIGLEYRFP